MTWLRACELELTPGLGARNEFCQPPADDVIEMERSFAQMRHRNRGNLGGAFERRCERSRTTAMHNEVC